MQPRWKAVRKTVTERRHSARCKIATLFCVGALATSRGSRCSRSTCLQWHQLARLGMARSTMTTLILNNMLNCRLRESLSNSVAILELDPDNTDSSRLEHAHASTPWRPSARPSRALPRQIVPRSIPAAPSRHVDLRSFDRIRTSHFISMPPIGSDRSPFALGYPTAVPCPAPALSVCLSFRLALSMRNPWKISQGTEVTSSSPPQPPRPLW